MKLSAGIRKIFRIAILGQLVAQPFYTQAQNENVKNCTTDYPQLQMRITYFCKAWQREKTDSSIELGYLLKTPTFNAAIEESQVKFVLHKNKREVDFEEMEVQSQKTREKKMDEVRKKIKGISKNPLFDSKKVNWVIRDVVWL